MTGNKKPTTASFWDLVQKKSFMERIVKMQSEEEVVEAFKKEGISLTPENLKELKEILNEAYEKLKSCTNKEIEEIKGQCNEISDDDLSAVAGGDFLDDLKKLWAGLQGLAEYGGECIATDYYDSKIGEINNRIDIVQGQISDLNKSLKTAGVAVAVTGSLLAIISGIRSAMQRRDIAKLREETNRLQEEMKKMGNTQGNQKAYYTAGAIGLGALALGYTYRNELKAWFTGH